MAKIKEIHSREILDAQGDPTVETTVILSDGSVGSASCPSGTMISKYESVEVRDHDDNRYLGKGVLKAIENIEKFIAPQIIGIEANKQQVIDKAMIELDGTMNKSRLGANATLSVSMAVAKAAAKSSVLPLYLYIREFIKKENVQLKMPTPIFNLINGGKHGGGNTELQEYLLIPATFKSTSESLQMGITVFKKLEKILHDNGFGVLTGREGGFSPNFPTNEDGFDFFSKAVNESGMRLGYDVFFGVDAESNYFFQVGGYKLKERQMLMSADDLIDFYVELIKKYHILYLEDPLSEDDWEGWAKLGPRLSRDTLIVGDDLTATNPYRLQMALDKKAINGIVIKPNQVGTVIEALAVVEISRIAGLKIIVSQRSVETNDDFIADFAVAVSADYIKFGAPSRGEHVVKYNRLLEIEKQIKIL